MDDGSLVGRNRDDLTALRARVAELKALGRSLEETAEIVNAELRSQYSDWTGGGNSISNAARIAYAEAN